VDTPSGEKGGKGDGEKGERRILFTDAFYLPTCPSTRLPPLAASISNTPNIAARKFSNLVLALPNSIRSPLTSDHLLTYLLAPHLPNIHPGEKAQFHFKGTAGHSGFPQTVPLEPAWQGCPIFFAALQIRLFRGERVAVFTSAIVSTRRNKTLFFSSSTRGGFSLTCFNGAPTRTI
jgi:hypothetical protein